MPILRLPEPVAEKPGFGSSILGVRGRTVTHRHMDSVCKQVLLGVGELHPGVDLWLLTPPDPEETHQPTGHLVVSVWG